MLSLPQIETLTEWRRARHRWPELSGQEVETAAAVAKALTEFGADLVLTGLGGTGVLAVFRGQGPGPKVMLRAELDALPIEEAPGPDWRSERPMRGHLCGHDGHMAILLGVAQTLSMRRPKTGQALLLFQPAEETGAGARAVLSDPDFAPHFPDWAFALHTMPGVPLGAVSVAEGPANCASVGMQIQLQGRTAHASTPDQGISPAFAVAELIPALAALGPGGDLGPGFRLVTVTHAQVGEAAFGIAPGSADLWATLRCLEDEAMADLRSKAVTLVQEVAARHRLGLRLDWHDDFAACRNDGAAVDRINAAFAAAGSRVIPSAGPWRASEDFGRFGLAGARSAMFLIGAGMDHPGLHAPDFDFPDALIPLAVPIFRALLDDLLGA